MPSAIKASNRISNSKRVKIRKAILLIFLILLFIASLITVILLTGNPTENAFVKHASDENPYNDDWAMLNYGQTIKDSTGITGIDLNIIPAWKVASTDQSVIVAVTDTGTDFSCDILKDKMLLNNNDPLDGIDNDNNGYIDDYYGWNFYDENNILYEDDLYDYHGTYISTTIAKVARSNASILPVKFMQSTSGSVDDAILAIKYAISRGARIINCSWNFGEPSDELYNIMKDNEDILFICSAGNSNINLEADALYPCSYDLNNIINVTAIDNQGKIHASSGYGKNTIHIAAPGVSVKVILPGNEETYIDGTSVAAAYVSSASALILSKNDKLTPQDIKKIIISTAQKNTLLESLCVAGGYLDIEACLIKSAQ
jgi:subtilisin family serine protease